ncbi:MAG: class I SAM-dependent methyltransferase [Desulfobacterales bacterium]|jgi:ubiquinone/menaquinone biosynthesis C-methylase UbiE|nr:class I SAM-dependent methyltransferase [Desulfobacterales bacterium]
MKAWIKIERIPGVLASAYEKATRMVIQSYYRPVAAEIAANLNEGTILDLGTGPGYLPIEIAKRSPTLNVIGVDLSRKLIEMASSNASKAGLADRLAFQSGNAGRLEFADSSFDMVISTGMLHSLKEPVAVLQEIHRVLKAGREAWIFDPAKVASRVDREKWKASLTLRERFFLRLFKIFGLHKPIQTYTRKQAIALIEQTDFKDFSVNEKDKEIKIKLKKANGTRHKVQGSR